MGTNSKLNNKPQDNDGEVDDFTAILHHEERGDKNVDQGTDK